MLESDPTRYQKSKRCGIFARKSRTSASSTSRAHRLREAFVTFYVSHNEGELFIKNDIAAVIQTIQNRLQNRPVEGDFCQE